MKIMFICMAAVIVAFNLLLIWFCMIIGSVESVAEEKIENAIKKSRQDTRVMANGYRIEICKCHKEKPQK
ncbi:MAG: hypothetical protein RR416_04445 [Clostridia bacterium]